MPSVLLRNNTCHDLAIPGRRIAPREVTNVICNDDVLVIMDTYTKDTISIDITKSPMTIKSTNGDYIRAHTTNAVIDVYFDHDAFMLNIKNKILSSLRSCSEEEAKSVHDYVESISEPTGVTFDSIKEDTDRHADILGADYKIITSNMSKYPRLERASGYCDFNIHTIVVDEYANPDQDATADMDAFKNKVLRHELTHAFLHESGLDVNSWADNEEIVDWFAIQAPKMFKVFSDLNLL